MKLTWKQILPRWPTWASILCASTSGLVQPRPGDYNPEAFRELDIFIRLAHQYGLYLHPTLFIGGEGGELSGICPGARDATRMRTRMLRLQADHAAEFARRYRRTRLPGLGSD